MGMMSEATVKARIICLPVIFLLGVCLLYVSGHIIENKIASEVILPRFGDQVLNGSRNALKAAVDIEAETIAQELKNTPSAQDKMDMVTRLTDPIRFFDDRSGYFFTYTLDGVRVNVPINKKLNGQNCIDLKDDKGTMIVKEFIDAARNGGGFVQYYFEKEGKGTQPKLSYVRLIPGTNILIGTGVYIDNVEAETSQLRAQVESKSAEYSIYKIGALAFSMALIGLASVFVIRSITKPLFLIGSAARIIAAGNLDHATNASSFPGEIRDLQHSLRQMVVMLKGKILEADERSEEGLREAEKARQAMEMARQAQAQAESAKREGMLQAAGRLEKVVERLTSASAELSAQIEESSRGTKQQKQRLGETVAAVEQMNSSVMEVARSSSNAAQNATVAKEKAQAGEQVVDKAVSAIRKVEASSTAMKGQVEDLSQRASGIGSIMQIIEDIADQTNLLALNAAIEAARAGDAGRGFAVVADEVRKLAEKTMGATKDVGSSIREIQNSIAMALRHTDETGGLVVEATALSGESGKALQEIVQISEKSASQIQSIAAAAEEQSAASEQIAKSAEEVSVIATETADAMNQSSQAVADLAKMAGELKELIRNMQS